MIGNAMLVTTCPECHTTFRISVGILEKAGGQVRCGRCTHIFDANTALREIDEPASTAKYSTEFKFHLRPDTDAEARPDPIEDRASSDEAEAEREAVAESEAETETGTDAATEPEAETDSEPQADAASWAKAGADPGDDDEDATAGRAPETEATSLPVPAWLPDDEPVDRKSWAWAGGAVILALALVGQFVHQYRTSLVAAPVVGPALDSVYALFGQDVQPAVDLDRYDLLDLTAVAEPSGEEQGWLMIETRVRNLGPEAQPYPHVFVRLLDRWEETIAGRYFAPNEYTIAPIRDGARMNAGSTIDAQFIIMDPGPSATGFELELCVETTNGFQCESDLEQ